MLPLLWSGNNPILSGIKPKYQYLLYSMKILKSTGKAEISIVQSYDKSSLFYHYFSITAQAPDIRLSPGIVCDFLLEPPAAQCLRCQFAPVAALRSALHSYRTFTTRGLNFIDRCGGVPPLSIRAGRCASLRSALVPNIYYSRSILY